LITDDPACGHHPLADPFQRTQLLATVPATSLASNPADTELARLMAAAVECLRGDAPALTWIHARGMRGVWDAPWEFRDQFRDEEDPPPLPTVQPPSFRVAPDEDPDVLQGWLWAYAGQVVLLDLCLGPLLDAVERIAAPTLLLLTGAGGFPLAEHGAFGEAAEGLYSERLHVPLIVRLPEGEGATVRCRQLVQPSHVCATLREWFGLEPSAEAANPHLASLLRLVEEPDATWAELAWAGCPGQWALRTPCWLARLASVSAHLSTEAPDWDCQLFLKPDDRWEVNDVADRCPQVVHAMQRLLARIQAAPNLSTEPITPLEDVLRQPM